jgi:F-type H+-transporting ATPase subunit b
MPQLDPTSFPSQIFWLVVTFLFLWWLMAKVALPKVGLVLEERQKKINDSLDMADDLRKEAGSELDAYDVAISTAHDEARKVINDANQEGTQASADQLAEMRISLTNQIAEVEAEIESVKEKALNDISQSAREVAISTLDNLVGIKVPAKTLNAAIDDAMTKGRK